MRAASIGCLAVTALAAARADTLNNPASDLCKKDGATVVMETTPSGSRQGICVFPSGSRISEWAYFRNKHRLLR